MKRFWSLIFLLLTPTICEAKPEWRKIEILDVIELFNYESRRYYRAITIEGNDLPIIIDRNIANCTKILAGQTISAKTEIIPDPYIKNSQLKRVIAVRECD